MKYLSLVSTWLLIVGALNWGLVGLLNVDLVAKIFGTVPPLDKAVYVLVGLAGAYELAAYFKLVKK